MGRNVCKPRRPRNPEEIKPLDAENAKRLLEAARGDRLEALYILAFTTGLRIGELLGLKWEDLDGEAGVLRVRRTKSQAKTGPLFTAPKNGKGRSKGSPVTLSKPSRPTRRPRTPSSLE